jgi:hypothetical protein
MRIVDERVNVLAPERIAAGENQMWQRIAESTSWFRNDLLAAVVNSNGCLLGMAAARQRLKRGRKPASSPSTPAWDS